MKYWRETAFCLGGWAVHWPPPEAPLFTFGLQLYTNNTPPLLFPNHHVKTSFSYHVSILLESTGPFFPSKRIPNKENFPLNLVKLKFYSPATHICTLGSHGQIQTSKNYVVFLRPCCPRSFLVSLPLRWASCCREKKQVLSTLVCPSYLKFLAQSPHLPCEVQNRNLSPFQVPTILSDLPGVPLMCC